jgi:hypothetical protein
MSEKRDPTVDNQSAQTARVRRQSGIGARGHGIRVQDDASFDPHRFQTFEVTPAFRQRILEAPLPLLEVRDRLLQDGPTSYTRRRSGPNDVTQPEIDRMAAAPATARPSLVPRLEAQRPSSTTRAARPTQRRQTSASRIGLFSGAMALTFLGLTLAQWYTRHGTPTNDSADDTAKRMTVPAAPANAAAPHEDGNSVTTEPPAAETKPNPAASGVAARANALGPTKGAIPKAPAKKKLWLPVE